MNTDFWSGSGTELSGSGLTAKVLRARGDFASARRATKRERERVVLSNQPGTPGVSFHSLVPASPRAGAAIEL